MWNLGTKHYVKISAASARLKFIECGPTCIQKKNCVSRCCDMVTHPNGMLVTIYPHEEKAIKARGVDVIDGILQPTPGTKGCPFKNEHFLCSLHNTPDKPFGCIASPFMLNRTDTLVVRNRYKLLPCYDKDGDYAYRVFFTSLVKIFGQKMADVIRDRLDDQDTKGIVQNFYCKIPTFEYHLMSSRERILNKMKGSK